MNSDFGVYFFHDFAQLNSWEGLEKIIINWGGLGLLVVLVLLFFIMIIGRVNVIRGNSKLLRPVHGDF